MPSGYLYLVGHGVVVGANRAKVGFACHIVAFVGAKVDGFLHRLGNCFGFAYQFGKGYWRCFGGLAYADIYQVRAAFIVFGSCEYHKVFVAFGNGFYNDACTRT